MASIPVLEGAVARRFEREARKAEKIGFWSAPKYLKKRFSPNIRDFSFSLFIFEVN
jgi:hypothetical protein